MNKRKRIAAALTTLILAQQVVAAPAYYLAIPLKPSESSTGSPETPSTPTPIPQALLTSSAKVSFAVSQAGELPVPQQLLITNSGTAPATVQSLSLIGADAALFELQAPCLDLAVGANCEAYVYFKGTAAGDFKATLDVAYSGGRIKLLQVPIEARVVAPSGVLIGAGDFGNVPVGSAKDLVVKLKNTGIGRLVMTNAQVSGTGFSLVGTDCTSSLPVGGSCSSTVRMEGVEAKQQTGQFSITAGGSLLSMPLSGTGQQSNLSFSSGAIAGFGQVNVGETATSTLVTLKNTGNVAAQALSVSVSDPRFAVVGSTCSSTLAAGASCTQQVTFTPDGAGAVTAELLVASDGDIQARMPLSGVGASSTVLIGASTTQFQGLLGLTQSWYYTLTNSSAQPLTINGFDVSHASGLATVERRTSSSECGTTLAGGATCRYTFGFSSSGAVPLGTVSFKADTSSGIFENSQISGYVSWAQLKPTPANPNLSFGSVQLGQFADSVVITLENLGLRIQDTALIYSIPSDFQLVNNTCGDRTARQTSCSLQVRFAPKKAGEISGVIALTTQPVGVTATPFTLSIPVKGTSVAPTNLGWSGGAYDLVEVNSSRDLAFTLYNPAATSVSLGAASVVGNSEFSLRSSTCGSSLASKASCQVEVTYSPVAAGASSPATLTIQAGGTVIQKSLTASAAAAILKPSRTSLPFSGVYRSGTGATNAFSSISMTVQNTGAAAAEELIPSIVYDDPAKAQSFYFNNSTCVNRLNAGATCSVQIRAAGPTVGNHSGKVIFESASHKIELPFTVSIYAPEVGIAVVTPVATTKVGSGSLSSYSVTMDTTRKGDLATTAPTITGNTKEFSVASGTTCSGVFMGPSAKCVISVLFTPTDVGTRTPATLNMTIGGTKRTVTLQGTGE